MVSVPVPLSKHSLYKDFTEVTYCWGCVVAEYMCTDIRVHMCSLKCCKVSKVKANGGGGDVCVC